MTRSDGGPLSFASTPTVLRNGKGEDVTNYFILDTGASGNTLFFYITPTKPIGGGDYTAHFYATGDGASIHLPATVSVPSACDSTCGGDSSNMSITADPPSISMSVGDTEYSSLRVTGKNLSTYTILNPIVSENIEDFVGVSKEGSQGSERLKVYTLSGTPSNWTGNGTVRVSAQGKDTKGADLSASTDVSVRIGDSYPPQSSPNPTPNPGSSFDFSISPYRASVEEAGGSAVYTATASGFSNIPMNASVCNGMYRSLSAYTADNAKISASVGANRYSNSSCIFDITVNASSGASVGITNFTASAYLDDSSGNSVGETADFSLDVLKGAEPECTLSVDPSSGMIPFSPSFEVSATGGRRSYRESDFSIDFGDGSSTTGSSASHTYSSDGTYTATGSVSDGVNTASCSALVDVQPEPDYEARLVPEYRVIEPGGEAVYALRITRNRSFHGPVSVKVTGLVARLVSPNPEFRVSVSPAVIPASSDEAEIRIATDKLIFQGKYPFLAETESQAIGKKHDVAGTMYVGYSNKLTDEQKKNDIENKPTGPCGCKIAAKRVGNLDYYRWGCFGATVPKNIFIYALQGGSFSILQPAATWPTSDASAKPRSGVSGTVQYGVGCYADGKDINPFGTSGGETSSGGSR
jgi:hypothetical protein